MNGAGGFVGIVQLVWVVGMVDRKDASWLVHHLVSLFLLLLRLYALNQKISTDNMVPGGE